MRNPVTCLWTAILLGVLLGVSACPGPNNGPDTSPAASTISFPDFGFMVSPSDYDSFYVDQPVFRLKTDFPAKMPPAANMPAFMNIDFTQDGLAYMEGVRDYAFEGNLPNWDPFTNPVRQWYHIPWLHPSTAAYPPYGGTEGFHGLIKEAAVEPNQLSEAQDTTYQVFAITLVNEYAGYTMYQMWKDPTNPNPAATDARYGGGFALGTVFAKLLFTDAPGSEVPYLQNPLAWNAYISKSWSDSVRTVKQVHLLQMDIAVRDPRADPWTGWVFGTFVYNGAVNNPNKFMNLVPLGVMWGNEPDDTTNAVNPFPPKPIADIINPNLTQQTVFGLPNTPPQHLGWNSRLNGPADLNTASCMSCHITAQYPQRTSLVADGMVPAGGPNPPAQGGSPEWMKWFQNIKAGMPMDTTTYSTDFSFQVAIALQNFYTVNNADVQGLWADEYKNRPIPIGRGGDPR